MTADEARAELGLAVPAGPEEVRRAYLRGVRAHPPDRDPEGFQRVREAYERLGGEARGAAGAPPRVGINPPPPVERPSTDASPAPAAVVLRRVPEIPRRPELEELAADFVACCRAGDMPTSVLIAHAHPLALALFDFGMADRGREAVQALDERIARTGVRARELPAAAAASLVIVHELSALAERMGGELPAAFAYAVKTDDYRVVLRTLKTEEDRRGSIAKHQARTLAPTLFRAAARWEVEAFPRRARTQWSKARMFAYGAVVLYLVSKCFHS